MIWQFAPHMIAMALLLVCSAFFSCSEAALFYLSPKDRRAMQAAGGAQRLAAGLLDNPDRLLTAILFWNLCVNMAYFTILSLVGLRLEQEGRAAEAGLAAVASLLAIIFFSEMLPKNVGVLLTRPIATAVGIPLSMAIRIVDPILPALHTANIIARRIFFPSVKPEPYLEIDDLERAVALSTPDPNLLAREEATLQNIVSLSELRVEEIMRPRTQYVAFRPPVRLADVKGRLTHSDYLLVTEPDSDDIAAALGLSNLPELPSEHLEHLAERVAYVPWSATVATTLHAMRRRDHEVAAVINEFGETVGIVTLDDILDTLFHEEGSRSARLLARASISPQPDGAWHVTGMTGLRRLVRRFRVSALPTKSVTVGGLLQEVLQRVPVAGDEIEWGGLHFRVVNASKQGPVVVRLSQVEAAEGKA